MSVPNILHSEASESTRLKEGNRTAADRLTYLRIALVVVGVAFIVGIATFIKIWPSGWSWHTG
jgi:hypothetical protein